MNTAKFEIVVRTSKHVYTFTTEDRLEAMSDAYTFYAEGADVTVWDPSKEEPEVELKH
jgi:hypothetical protein